MKTLTKILAVVPGVMLVSTLCQPALAGLVEAGSSTLPSATVLGDAVTINWQVLLNAGVYEYDYQVVNGPNGAANLDFFSVAFNNIAGAVTGGNETHNKPTGVDWSLGPLALGGSTPALGAAGQLFFTSNLAPVNGPADASDAIPPSPFLSGDKVPVPNIPDGGLTVAMLGFALVGVESLRRKLKK